MLNQAKFSIEKNQIEFLNNYKKYGFKDKSSMVRTALTILKKKFDNINLKKSADLYVEIFSNDNEIKELTESALTDWLE